MANANNKLSATAVRNAKPREKTYRLADGGGMYLEVTPTGGTYWRMKYRFHGKEKRLAIGVYPAVSLAGARTSRDEARKQLAQGLDPSTSKRVTKELGKAAAESTFKTVATEWLEHIHRHEVVADHYERNKSRLTRDAFPALGHRPITDITPPELLDCLRRIEKRGHLETAHRVKTLCGQVFRYAISTGRAERDLTPDLKGALRTPKTNHHAAITDPAALPPLLSAIDGYGGMPVTITALKLSPLVFVRPGELRQARWEDFDLDRGEWAFKPSKNADPLIVPLPHQAVTMLTELHRLTGRGEYVFPGARSSKRPMSNTTIKAALDRMGFKGEMTAHGFRAMARTILAERLGYPEQYIEQQLAHKVRDANGSAYNRTTHLEQRREMLQSWADYLDALRAGAGNVVPIYQRAKA
ncbi:tyrosine-type recombinase/integrase [Vreelandella sp. TE19]